MPLNYLIEMWKHMAISLSPPFASSIKWKWCFVCVCFFSLQTWNLFEIENSKVKFIHIENVCHKISVLLSTCGLHIYIRVLNSCWRCAKYKLDISKYEFGSFNSQNTARNHAYGFINVQFIMHTSRGWTKITIINVNANANANAILIMIYYEYDLDV